MAVRCFALACSTSLAALTLMAHLSMRAANAETQPATGASPAPALAQPPIPSIDKQPTRSATELPSLAALGLRDGDVVSAANLAKHETILTPGVRWAVQHGWRLRVVEPRLIAPPIAYREATDKYAAQVRLGDDGRSLQNYVAGQPFPSIDTADPQAAVKIMWNLAYGFWITDDAKLSKIEQRTGTIRPAEAMTVEQRLLADSYMRLNYQGRIFVDPRPSLQNPDLYRLRERFGPLVEPFDLKGDLWLAGRYLNADRQDDTWMYLPSLRRVRRVPAAQRAAAVYGTDMDPDTLWGFNGSTAFFKYRLLGEAVILAPLHARNVPVHWQQPEDWLYDDVWEPRRVWVVEAQSTLPQYDVGKRLLFIDRQAWVVPVSDLYDLQGNLWKVWISMISTHAPAAGDLFAQSAGGRRDESLFVHASVMIDTRAGHATASSFPAGNSTVGWVQNLGKAPPEEFELFHGCLAAGTLVLTKSGMLPVESVHTGLRLLTLNPNTGDQQVVTVQAVRQATAESTLLVGGRLRVTPEHPVWANGAWKRAGDLTVGDELLSPDGTEVLTSRPMAIAEPVRVYDIVVDGPHSFVAGGLLVHNKVGR